ncbi:hypothetical protein [Georgenia sp. Z1491]|uniref:hypothetical protein n=1 Tax=Georgenia sp. Z1491 TaxID=3416707 RepID=UPI003CF56C8E
MDATRRGRRRARTTALVAASSLLVLTGCGGDEALTEDDAVERVATAMREAPTFSFEWTSDIPDAGTTTDGVVRYDDEGEVDLLSLTTRDHDGSVTLEVRLIDGTMYERTGGAGEYAVLDDEARANHIEGWDWAGATEAWGDPESMEEVGEADVEGTTTVEYEVDLGDQVHRWWVDDEDRLLRIDTGPDGGDGILRDWGEPVDVQVPDGVESS